MGGTATPWFDEELAGCRLADKRLGRRLRQLVERMGGSIGASIPLACQDWANTKAAYRFFSNDRVGEADILAGHFQSTRGRFVAASGPILVLQDTTEFTYQRESTDAIGMTYRIKSGKDKAGRFRMHTVCGLLMHSSLAVTLDGLPLGLSAVKFWTRSKFKGTAALKKKINPTRVPNDIYELFCMAHDLGTHFLVRTCVDRLAGDGDHTIAAEMKDALVEGFHEIEVRDDKGNGETATVEIRYRRIRVLPPIGKQKRYPALELTVIYAQERDEPQNRPRIDWKLIFEIMMSKVWSMGLVVLTASALSVVFVVEGLLAVPVNGSLVLFLAGAALDIFAMTCLGIFLPTVAGSMPQFGLLLMMVLMPLQLLSGGVTPRESMPEVIQFIMLAAPNTHFVMLAQAVLFRGAGLDGVWPQLVAMFLIGGTLFVFSLSRFRHFLQ